MGIKDIEKNNAETNNSGILVTPNNGSSFPTAPISNAAAIKFFIPIFFDSIG